MPSGVASPLTMSSENFLPYFAEGTVVSGFGRGSKELGIPTANFPNDVVNQLPQSYECGVYYGWALVDGIGDEIYKMVLSVGWNVYYGSEMKTMETHIIHKFDTDFYGKNLKIIILGFIRPMCNFDSLDALITAIHKDIQHAEEQLDKPEKLTFKSHLFFKSSTAIETSTSEENLSIGKCVIDKKESKITNPSIKSVNQTCNRHLTVSSSKHCRDEFLLEKNCNAVGLCRVRK